MKSALSYLVQVIIASGILYSYYHLVLRNKRFHQYNRFYLLAAVVISVFIPLLQIPVYFTESEQASGVLQIWQSISPGNRIVLNNSTNSSHMIGWRSILLILYIVIIIALIFRLIFSLKKIRTIIRNNPVEEVQNVHFVNTVEPGTPYSFFRWLFWNQKIELRSDKGEQIFRHEMFHIRQKHSFDLVFMELITAVVWINPFFHLVKKELKAIHEFLADRYAADGTEKSTYAELLLMQALKTNQSIVNPFFHNQIKRRIAMIASSSKPGQQYFRKIMALPLLILLTFLLAFTYKTKENKNAVKESVGVIIGETTTGRAAFPDTGKPKQPPHLILKEVRLKDSMPVTQQAPAAMSLVVIDGVVLGSMKTGDLDKKIQPNDIESINVLKGSVAIAKYGNKGKNGVLEITTKKGEVELKEVYITDVINEKEETIFQKVEIEPAFPGGSAAWAKFLINTLNSKVGAQNSAPQGKYAVEVQFIVTTNGAIKGLVPLTTYGYGMEQEVIRVMNESPKWVPAILNGKQVNAYQKQTVTFVIDENPMPTTRLWENASKMPTITLAELRKGDVHRLLQLDKQIEIISYAFAIDTKENDIAVAYNSGNSFNKYTVALINDATPGKLVTFDKIVTKVGGKEQKLAGRVYKLID
jgi:TonB-dependent SusC/RagA subfamily outer membrane receptor